MASAEKAEGLEEVFLLYAPSYLLYFEPRECTSYSETKSLNEVARVHRAEETVWWLLGQTLKLDQKVPLSFYPPASPPPTLPM